MKKVRGPGKKNTMAALPQAWKEGGDSSFLPSATHTCKEVLQAASVASAASTTHTRSRVDIYLSSIKAASVFASPFAKIGLCFSHQRCENPIHGH